MELGGTSLQDLQKMQYGANQNMHYEQGHNAQDMMHQAQHAPYYSMDSMEAPQNYPNQYMNPSDSQMRQPASYRMDTPDLRTQPIQELAQDIAANLPEDILLEEEEPISKNKRHSINTGNSSFMNMTYYIPNYIKEPLILIMIYIILSQPAVQTVISQYTNSYSPNMVILIYAVLLTVLFILIKRLLI